MIACHEIVTVMDIVSTKKTNTIATNVPINCCSEQVRHEIDCYILLTVLLAIILPLITIDHINYFLLSLCTVTS